MANFKYKAISIGGEKVNGVVEATDQMAAVAKIKQTCSIIVAIEEVQTKEGKLVPKGKRIDVKDLCLMCDRLAIILGVGLPITKAVDMLAGQMENRSVKAMLQEVSKDVSMGRSLASSFAAREGMFPVTFIESVRSGEESGNLVETFRRMNQFYDKTNKTKQKVISALTYPALTMVVAVIVIAIIMVKAVPMFSGLFAGFGQELPAITQFVVNMSNFTRKYGIFIIFVIAAMILAGKMWQRTEAGAEFFSAMLLGLPIVGKMVQLSAASQFSHTMSMMLASGMPILSCIETAGRGIGNYIMRRDILSTVSGVEEGRTFSSCLAHSKYLPSMLIEMIAMGEATGTMETTLSAVGGFYDNEVELATSRAVSVLEPMIICVLAVFIVLILLAVYLPMFSMYGNM